MNSSERRRLIVTALLTLLVPATATLKAGKPTAPVPRVTAEELQDDLAGERRMCGLLNADRRTRGLVPLKFDVELAAVAREHSRDMAVAGFFSHESPTTGSPADRIFRAGIMASATGENLARNYSVERAQVALMNSPPHRANILSRDFDQVGIGIVVSSDTLWVTQNFRRALSSIEPSAEADHIVTSLNSRRAAKRLKPLTVDPRLDQLARTVASEMNRAQELLPKLPGQSIRQVAPSFREFWSWTGFDSSAADLAKVPDALRPRLNSVGVGVIQNITKSKGLGMLWVVVLLADL